MTNKEIIQNNKILAHYLDYKYVPSNDMGEFRTPGWYKPLKTNSTYEERYRKISNNYYICRSHLGLNFQNDYSRLFEVIDKLEKENLSEYFDKGNFMYVSVDRFDGRWSVDISFSFDPPDMISGDKKEKTEDKKQLYLALVDAVKYINQLKEE